jgi:hypothetical protein
LLLGWLDYFLFLFWPPRRWQSPMADYERCGDGARLLSIPAPSRTGDSSGAMHVDGTRAILGEFIKTYLFGKPAIVGDAGVQHFR